MSEEKKRIIFFDRIMFCSVLALIFCIPFTKGGIEAALITGVVALVFRSVAGKEIDLKEIPLFIPLIIYLSIVALSVIYSIDVAYSLTGILRVLKYTGLYLLVVCSVHSEKRLMWVARAVLLAAILASINGIYQWTSGWDFRHQFPLAVYENVKRVRGSFNHPNNFAGYLSCALFICYFLKDRKFFWSACQYLSLPLILFVLLLTKSRAPVLMTFIIFIFVIIASRYRKYTAVIFLSGCAAILFYSFFETSFLPHLFKAFLFTINDRWRYWQTSLPIIKNHFFFGTGTNTFMEAFSQTADPDMYGKSRFTYAHSFIIQYWAEIGIVGLSSFLYLLTAFFIQAKKYWLALNEPSKRTLFGCILGIVVFLMHAAVDNNMQSLQTHTFFWLLFGVVMGAGQYETVKSPHSQS